VDLTIKQGKTLVVVTHNEELASQADQVLRLTDGMCACEAT
jgi:ABC-type lipoprotein export system ATPase subunit